MGLKQCFFYKMSYTATINPKHYHYIMKKIRQYFDEQGLTECYLSDQPQIISACENIDSISIYEWDGLKFPHQQTSQILMEYCILRDTLGCKGYYNTCNSFRVEKNPVKNRHVQQFALLECESDWNFREMIDFQKGLLRAVGIKPFHGDDFPEITYKDACLKYNVNEIGHSEEIKLCHDLNSPAVFLTHFTLDTNPFWNMQKVDDHVLKVDVIIGKQQPMEVIGSATRSNNVEEMYEMFHTMSNGKYAEVLYNEFGKDRVDAELKEYLSLPFKQRSGMGIGMGRLVFACQSLGIFDHLD